MTATSMPKPPPAKKISIILDTDPGIDDAAAITAALCHPLIDVRLITTVAGNVGIDKTTNNVLRLLDFFGATIPVARGAVAPLLRQVKDASHVHGVSGMDGYDFGLPQRSPLPEHAVEAIRQTLVASETPLVLATLGPLTNLALFLSLYPEYASRIERIVMMGGSAVRGNDTPAAEFNIYADPEAAAVVFRSGLPIVMCGLDVTNQATLSKETIATLSSLNRTGAMLHALFQHYRGGSIESGLQMHDLCVIAYLTQPDLFSTRSCYVAVETQGKFTVGATVVDLDDRWQKTPNAQVCLKVDVEGFRRWTLDVLALAV